MKLVVVSNLAHHRRNGRIVAAWPGPVAEIDALCGLFREAVHVAELHPGAGPPSAAPYQAANLRTRLVRAAGGRTVRGRARGLLAAPAGLAAISEELRDADAAYVRCPSRLGFLGLLALTAPGGPRARWARYTGEWRRPGDPPAYRFQQLWLRAGLARLTTAVYGGAGRRDSSGWVQSWPNPCLDSASWRNAGDASRSKQLARPLRLLFVGRFDENKGPHRAVRIAAAVRDRGMDVRLDLAGDGPLRKRVESDASRLLEGAGRVHGSLDRAGLHTLYARAHVLLAPSRTEGWPKAVTEAMAHRVVPAASTAGALPEMLRGGKAGLLLAGEPPAWAEAIDGVVRRPDRWRLLADEARRASADSLVESYVDRIRRLLRASLTTPQSAEAPL